jgi:hypothetical protein
VTDVTGKIGGAAASGRDLASAAAPGDFLEGESAFLRDGREQVLRIDPAERASGSAATRSCASAKASSPTTT